MNTPLNALYFDGCYNSNSCNANDVSMTKKYYAENPNSLLRMAMYDVDSMTSQEYGVSSVATAVARSPAPGFYPVDEYKDMSLKEILDISDDLIFGDDDPLMSVPFHDTAECLEPTPFPPSKQPNPSISYYPSSSQPEPFQPMVITSAAPNMEVLQARSVFDSPFVSKKRTREEACVTDTSEKTVSEEDNEEERFRPYQAGQWSEKFEELCAYRRMTGNCLVPHTYEDNLPLARWVKRQRYQYKLMQEGKPSTMTEERVQALEEIGFIWDSQRAAWEERLGELEAFRMQFHHCNVPSNYAENPQLATWVKCQRRQYKLHMEGKASNMTSTRISQLENLGFEWELRCYKKARST